MMPALEPLPPVMIEPAVRAALLEDLGTGADLTSAAVVPADATAHALLVARKPGRLAGLACAATAFHLVDPTIRFTPAAADGAVLTAGQTVAAIEGRARPILTAERVALNFVQRLSGVATLTAAFVAAVSGTAARIVDTRKTTPGLRALEKYAVRCGGGFNHRFGLHDGILIKDNHIAALGGIRAALERARTVAGHMVAIEIEVDRLDQLAEALDAGATHVLLDNFSLDDLRTAVAMAGGRAVLEASGGVTLDSVRAIAATGVHAISSGALTHSAPALDLALDFA